MAPGTSSNSASAILEMFIVVFLWISFAIVHVRLRLITAVVDELEVPACCRTGAAGYFFVPYPVCPGSVMVGVGSRLIRNERIRRSELEDLIAVSGIGRQGHVRVNERR